MLFIPVMPVTFAINEDQCFSKIFTVAQDYLAFSWTFFFCSLPHVNRYEDIKPVYVSANMKHSKLNKSRKAAIKALYELCLEHQFTIVGTADFHDEGEEDQFEVDIGVAGVEIECLPKEEDRPRKPKH